MAVKAKVSIIRRVTHNSLSAIIIFVARAVASTFSLDAMSAPTTTISSLPYELLVAIAVAAQGNRVTESNWGIRSTTFKSEWTLSQLSHRFRDVIVGAPSLWTLIETDFISEGSVEILKLYLERSRASKLSVILLEPSETKDGLLRERVTEIIVPQVNRIQRLKIVWDLDQEMLGPFRDVAAPHLQHLEIVYRSDEFAVGAPVAMFWSGAPRLTFLKIVRSTLQLSPQPLPWMASITHLESLGGYDPGINLAAVTAQCPSLTHLHLDLTYVPPDANRFHIPTLKFLHISTQDNERADYLSYIVGLFDAPALAELILNGTHGDQVAFLLSLKSLPQSSFPVLTSISFICRGCLCETQALLPYHPLSSPPVLFPALSHLILVNQCHAYALIKDILGPALHPWPLLKTITLGAKDDSNDSFEGLGAALEDAVKSKRQRGEPVPEVQLFRVLSYLADWNENSPVDVERSW